MKTIYKYTLRLVDEQEIEMPHMAIPLCVANQDGNLVLWAEVNTIESLVKTRFLIVGTGNPIVIKDIDTRQYIGTVQQYPFVWHVYLIKPF